MGLNNIGFGPSGVVGVNFVNLAGVWNTAEDIVDDESTNMKHTVQLRLVKRLDQIVDI